jgi:glycosyltransferase involved in cell wall biosynthesis
MMEKEEILSIVVPCFNEEEALPIFFKALSQVFVSMENLEPEYIFVDDGSSDGTLRILRELSEQNPFVKYLSLSRNFGKEAALLAGLEASTGDFISVMDADMQDPPELLKRMYEIIVNKKVDCVATCRVTRTGEPPIRSFLARGFYKLINKISETQMVDGARDFRLMTRQMVDAIISLREYNRFSKGLFSWVGFTTKWIEYDNVERVAGTTKWSFWKLFLYSLDGITAFSIKPLALASLFGFLFCIGAFLGMLFIIVRYLMVGDPVAGWASTVTIVLFVGGIQLFCMGILGQYLARTYMEGKNRPVYIIRENGDGSRG